MKSISLQALLQIVNAFFRLQGKSILRIVLLVSTAVVITLLLPHKINFRYQYELNKPWGYKDLIAPFDFPVYKAASQIEQERSEALKEHLPYYQRDQQVPADLQKALERDFSASLSKPTLLQLQNALQSWYAVGVVQAAPLNEQGSFYLLNEGNKRIQKRLSQVLVIQQAYDNFKTLVNELGLSASLRDSLLVFGTQKIRPNLVYDEAFTEKIKAELLRKVVSTEGMVLAGELIIAKGSLVKDEVFAKVSSLEREYGGTSFSGRQKWLAWLGQLLLVSLILSMFIYYLYFFRKMLFEDLNRMMVLMLNLTLTIGVFSFASSQSIQSVYLIPLAILPMITRSLFDAWLAIMLLLVATLLTAFFSGYPSEFMVLQLTAGMAAIFSLISIRKRSQFYLSSGIVFLVYALGYTAYTLVSKGDLNELIPLYYGYFAVNALLTLIASPMLFGYEKVFGFVSDVSLMELSDTNSPLLRRLSYEAPGTFQHTLQVANLAEAAIFEVGGNALLTRVGALYHDIGKLTNPIYFIENQNAAINPHDDLPFEESAQIIIGHVLDGISLAKSHKLPNVLIDFIRTHHGDQRVEYFYQSYLRNFPEQEVDEQKFRYPGPKPFSKETAVLMMADSVEAASRSLKEPTAQSISDLVDAIVEKQQQQGQFMNADITMRDISRIKKLFKKMLNSIYHVRVEYPGQKQ